eukprot:2755214-Pyramimonas_sp.AAC.1
MVFNKIGDFGLARGILGEDAEEGLGTNYRLRYRFYSTVQYSTVHDLSNGRRSPSTVRFRKPRKKLGSVRSTTAWVWYPGRIRRGIHGGE